MIDCVCVANGGPEGCGICNETGRRAQTVSLFGQEDKIRRLFILFAGRFVNANRYQQNRAKADEIADEAVRQIMTALPIAKGEPQ